jgi:hypothetical protein
VSVSNRSSSLFLNTIRTGSSIHACLSVLNALLYFSVQLKGFSFFVSSISSIAIFKKFFMNCQLKLANPIKACTSLTVVGVGYSLTTLIFSGLILTPSLLTI